MNAYYAQQSYPQWSQPPFQGAPPIPNGMNISQQQWQQGQWQFNPAFNHHPPSSAPPQTQWAPAQGWLFYAANAANKPTNAVAAPNPFASQQAAVASQQAQAQVNRNPYKRYPKPPSQEYLSYELNDNGLGLFDMVPREEVYKDREPPTGADQTPWVWHPKRFPGEEDTGIVTAYFKDEHGNRNEQYRGQVNGSDKRSSTDQPERKNSTPKPTQEQDPSRPRSGSGILRRRDTGDSDHYQPTRELERAWEYEGERERAKDKHKKDKHKKDKDKPKDKSSKSDESPGSSFTRVSSTKPISRSTPTPISSASAYAEQQAQARLDRSQRVRFESPPSSASSLPQPVNPNQQQQPSVRSNTEPPFPSSISVPHHPQPSIAHEGFSSKAEFRPTFSSRIVRTPDHYRTNSSSAPSRSASVISRSSNSSSARSSDYMSANTSLTSVSNSSSPQPLTRHATAPAAFRVEHEPSTISGVPNLTEEPTSAHQLLSPLFPTHSHTRSLSRGSHHAYSLSSIPEGASVTSKHKHSPQRSNYSPAGSGSGTESESNASSPYWNGDPPSRSSPNTFHSQSTSRKRSPLSNPLPTPPRESQVPLSMPSIHERSSSTSDFRPQTGMRIRKGYWSRRGVHLTKDGDLVHPPEDRIFPQELSHYPEDTSIFQDHKGRQKRVEMWRQLPSHNRRIDDYISYVT